MIERTQKERELIADAERIFPTSTRCLTFEEDLNFCVGKAKGSHIWDVSGNEYIDYMLGSGPHILGHAHPAVLEALRTVPENGTSFLVINENAVNLGKKIIEHVPCAEMVSLHSSGSEATFFALRLARVYRKRDKILKFEGGYHGMHDYALMSNQWTMGSPPFPQAVPNTHGIPRVLNDEVLVAPFNNLEATAEIISKHHDELAGVIIEPVQRTFEPKPGFLQGVREITANFDIPLIFDEVVTGFRFGLGGAQELYGVTPDLCALGKAISGGLPLGVLCGREDIMAIANPKRRLQMLPYSMQTGTFSSNPVCTSVACAVISELEKPGVYERLEEVGTRVSAGLREAIAHAGIEACVTGVPSVFEIWFTKDEPFDHPSSKGSDFYKNIRFSDLLLQQGVLKAAEKFFVSAVHTDEDIERTIAAFHVALEQLAKELP
ncbi:MAG: aspartate aminotransferase family protein [Deltaproteobacteria bacterium]|nr:aminotransferase class III-fold pyridoxal phosphate-dependent enzyme [Deltaproteobacteria bacterium]MBW2223208.1 aminotransferase class III-fold pyridoxal phosphate-dependent enzyme [Deltaproteobacteria bacterium]MBW2404229.1 aminotransferase class III-fold pyridoxal phosphate-dependent enzyme [Deltaproteobacteria bacterium]MBW2547113.1 aminotransferase class III-fold pyridoxal phosphate-dependent enzyme [Deltaproteobacteria bacterium]MBW2717659.1 aminotransferase class III-fold pyridoxal ph